jgi:AraC-like DNA-binding protein
MDAIVGLLDGPRARGAFLLRAVMDQPWSVRVQDEAPLSLVAIVRGEARAALARRFTDLVGEPPMAYLTGWRLTLAADLLREPDATVGAVARQVGYASPFALSTAFNRVRGVSPRQHRVSALAK